MFLPLFEGQNTFVAADKLFNSIAKGSTYYIGDLIKKSAAFNGQPFDVTIKLKDQEAADKAKKVFTTAGCEVSGDAGQLKIKGDLGKVMGAALKDSDDMFYNRDSDVKVRYGIEGKEALYAWWSCFQGHGSGVEEVGKVGELQASRIFERRCEKGVRSRL